MFIMLHSSRFNIFKKSNYLLHAWSLGGQVSSAKITNLKVILMFAHNDAKSLEYDMQ